jgi:hypothetical protein
MRFEVLTAVGLLFMRLYTVSRCTVLYSRPPPPKKLHIAEHTESCYGNKK